MVSQTKAHEKFSSTPQYCSIKGMNESSNANPKTKLPAIKFYKDAVLDILAGRKTLEPRPRSLSWISHLEQAGYASLTYGPRFGASTVFAVARIRSITLRPFETATIDDLQRIGTQWCNRAPEEFIVEYTRWFAKKLAKGYPVAWISFEVVEP